MAKKKEKDNSYSPLSKKELYEVLDSVDDAIFIDDADGKTLWLNKACEKLYRIKKEDIIGIHISNLEEDGIFTPSVARMVLESKKQVDLIHQNKSGNRILSTGTPIFDENGVLSSVISTSRDITELVNLQNELEQVQTTLEGIQNQDKFYTGDVIAHSQSMFNVLQLVKRLAEIDSTVLITGESGVGKGVIAKLLHQNGNRSENPFIKVNCGAIPENLIESELFGYESGSFTGSRAEGKAGLFETASTGTIFLDEISELPLNLQVKLLQVLQDKEITRVGGVKPIPIDVRIISATNKDLYALIQDGKFREDLYYRLNVVPVYVPPLRDRSEDIIPLIKFFMDANNKNMNDRKEITPEAMAILAEYNWPGNVRELQNIVERLIITTRSSIIEPSNLPGYILDHISVSRTNAVPNALDGELNLNEALEHAEKEILLIAQKKYKSSRKMAKALGVSQPTIVRKLHKHNISSGIEE